MNLNAHHLVQYIVQYLCVGSYSQRGTTEIMTMQELNKSCSQTESHGDKVERRRFKLRQCVLGMYNYLCVCVCGFGGVFVGVGDIDPFAKMKGRSASARAILIMTVFVAD